jgi:hypothetical protein
MISSAGLGSQIRRRKMIRTRVLFTGAGVVAAVAIFASQVVAAGGQTAGAVHPAAKKSGAGRCQANALGISLTDLGAYSFHTGLAIEFKNRGSACTMTGYPGVDAVSATGRRILSAKRTKSGYIGGVFSGPIPKVHLAKGKTASALVEWVDGGPLGVPCPHAHSLRITPPGAVSSVILSPKSLQTETLCGVQVHPVVPGRSGRKT